jgi:hypothetical protein
MVEGQRLSGYSMGYLSGVINLCHDQHEMHMIAWSAGG